MEINKTCHLCDVPVRNSNYNKVRSGNFHLCDKHIEDWNEVFPEDSRDGEFTTKVIIFIVLIAHIAVAVWLLN